jgi:hypothetical protein
VTGLSCRDEEIYGFFGSCVDFFQFHFLKTQRVDEDGRSQFYLDGHTVTFELPLVP